MANTSTASGNTSPITLTEMSNPPRMAMIIPAQNGPFEYFSNNQTTRSKRNANGNSDIISSFIFRVQGLYMSIITRKNVIRSLKYLRKNTLMISPSPNRKQVTQSVSAKMLFPKIA